jgi:hypothetical protein
MTARIVPMEGGVGQRARHARLEGSPRVVGFRLDLESGRSFFPQEPRRRGMREHRRVNGARA